MIELMPNIDNSSIQKIYFSEIKDSGIDLFIKREDLIHPFISGNKYRKLKYNLLEAKKLAKNTLLTFGGAYSNHIAAVAKAGQVSGFKTIGIIRGEELQDNFQQVLLENDTLSFAHDCGMNFKFISRSLYRDKSDCSFILSLKEEYGDFYLIPEGGTNELAVKGCEEILDDTSKEIDCITTAVGTGGTISGLINSSLSHQKVIGFPALKGEFLNDEIRSYISKTNWELNDMYHFGGYAKTSDDLIIFINKFKKETGIPLDPIYTGKMLYGVIDLIKHEKFSKGHKILAIHTGGIQGINGMNKKLARQNKLIIE